MLIAWPKLKDILTAAASFTFGIAVVGGVYYVNSQAIDSILREDSKSTSLATTRIFESNLLDIADILKGAIPSKHTKNFVRETMKSSSVEKFLLYDLSGKIVLDSTNLDVSPVAIINLGEHNVDALAAVNSAEPIVILEQEERINGTELIVETYMPLMRAGKKIGAAEAYVNQTLRAQMLRRGFGLSSLLAAVVAALGFAVPAFGFHWRTRQKLRADDNVQFLANHDSLTRLPNRRYFMAQFDKKLRESAQSGKNTLVHFVDLDYFKELNDRYGHAFGDEMLCAVAGRLKGALRDGDLVSRIGGDEFLIAQFGLQNEEGISAATFRIADSFQKPFHILGQEIVATMSMGTAVSPQDGTQAEQLIKNADTAVYVVKAKGRNGHCQFEPKFDDNQRKRIRLEQLVREAVEQKSFEVFYQPIFKCASRELKGFEALLRLRDENGNYISPAEFIPVAENIGLIDEIGAWVLNTACMAAATWPSQLQLSVNLSVSQFRNQTICRSMGAALVKSKFDPKRLTLEVTESLLLSDAEFNMAQIRELKDLGLSIAMDDFGTGYSSLSYMLKYPFDIIKIDRAFVSALSSNNEMARTMVETIITLGHTMNMKVTAEGVEEESQADILQALHCDDVQGFLFGKPVEASEISSIILNNFNYLHFNKKSLADSVRGRSAL